LNCCSRDSLIIFHCMLCMLLYVVTTDGTDCFLRIPDDGVSEKC